MGALPEQPGARLHRTAGRRRSAAGPTRMLLEAEPAPAQGDMEGASPIPYARILSEDETHPKAIGGLAKLHVEAGDLDQARAVLSMAPPTARRARIRDSGDRWWPGPAVRLAEQAASVGDLAPLEQRSPKNPGDDHQARLDPRDRARTRKGDRDSARRISCWRSSGANAGGTRTLRASSCCSSSKRGV